jgi:hypothetical protein
MALEIGEGGYGQPQVVEVYVGTVAASKIYLGSQQAWPVAAPSSSIVFDSYYWAHYNNSPSSDPMGTSLTGVGTVADPAVATIGTNYYTVATNSYGDARLWAEVLVGGTLSYTLTYKNPGGYNGGDLLYKTTSTPSQHSQSFSDAVSGFTLINSASNSSAAGTVTTKTGTVAVSAGDFIVLRWYQDDGGTRVPESKVTMSIA